MKEVNQTTEEESESESESGSDGESNQFDDGSEPTRPLSYIWLGEEID